MMKRLLWKRWGFVDVTSTPASVVSRRVTPWNGSAKSLFRFLLGVAGVTLLLVGSGLVGATHVMAQEAKRVTDKERDLVPHRLLQLIHAPEVHEELGWSSSDVNALESWLPEVDGPWFRSRNLAEAERFKELDRLEATARSWLSEHLDRQQQQRLKQLEWQSLGARMLFRTDFARELRIRPEQQAAMARWIREASATSAKTEDPSNRAKENAFFESLLDEDQKRRFPAAMGKPFETHKLTRIYPMAPELVPSSHWLNSSPLSLESLRGKVVLVHFYAFQCSNCQANFAIYQRWHERLQERGVVVLGIQTPETPAERDPAAIAKAAKERGLSFPILLDLESKNWDTWSNTMWPTVYVVDKRGYLRQWWQGELNWKGATGDATIEAIVNAALSEPAPE